MNDSIYAITTNVVQTTEKKNNKTIEKVNDLHSNLNIEEQPKDSHNNLKTIEKNTRPIPKPDFDIDPPRKPPIVLKLFNLRMKISENILCIIIKTSIYIYLKDLQEACVF